MLCRRKWLFHVHTRIVCLLFFFFSFLCLVCVLGSLLCGEKKRNGVLIFNAGLAPGCRWEGLWIMVVVYFSFGGGWGRIICRGWMDDLWRRGLYRRWKLWTTVRDNLKIIEEMFAFNIIKFRFRCESRCQRSASAQMWFFVLKSITTPSNKAIFRQTIAQKHRPVLQRKQHPFNIVIKRSGLELSRLRHAFPHVATCQATRHVEPRKQKQRLAQPQHHRALHHRTSMPAPHPSTHHL